MVVVASAYNDGESACVYVNSGSFLLPFPAEYEKNRELPAYMIDVIVYIFVFH